MLIYKILRQNEWETFQEAGETRGAPIDIQDGYIHFSTAQQLLETARKHFSGEEGLVLLACDTIRFKNMLKWENSRNNDLFPHLYSLLKIQDILWAKPLPYKDGVHQFPTGLE